MADGRTVAVEVKSGNAHLTKEQCGVMNALASANIDCYTWHPSRGLTLYQRGTQPPLPRMYGAPQDKYTKAFSDKVMAEHRRVRVLTSRDSEKEKNL